MNAMENRMGREKLYVLAGDEDSGWSWKTSVIKRYLSKDLKEVKELFSHMSTCGKIGFQAERKTSASP